MKLDNEMLVLCSEIVARVDKYFLIEQHVIHGENHTTAKCEVKCLDNGGFQIDIPIPFPEVFVTVTKKDSGYVDLSNYLSSSDITMSLYRMDEVICAFNTDFSNLFIETLMNYIKLIVSDYENDM